MPDDRRPITWPRAVAALDQLNPGQRQAVPTIVEDELANRRQVITVQPDVPVMSQAARLLVDVALEDLTVRLGAATTCRPAYDLIERGDGRLTLSFLATIDVVGINAYAARLAAGDAAAKQTAQDAITEAVGDGMPLGGRKEI